MIMPHERCFEQADGMKLILAILVSGAVTHFTLQVIVLGVGGLPDFTDTHSLGINVGVTSFFLSLGWLLRRVTFVSLVFLGLGLGLVVLYMFTMKGSLVGWTIQIATYTVLPLLSASLFRMVCKAVDIPDRPRLKVRTHKG